MNGFVWWNISVQFGRMDFEENLEHSLQEGIDIGLGQRVSQSVFRESVTSELLVFMQSSISPEAALLVKPCAVK